AKPVCAAGLRERGFDRGRDMFGSFKLRVVTDIIEGDDAKARNPLSRMLGDVGAGSWIRHAPDEAERHRRSFERAFPPRGVGLALAHVPEEFRCHRDAATPPDELPLLVEVCRRRLMPAREDR